MIRGVAAAASDPVAAAAARAALDAGGSAADALIAGFLAAAGARPGVLFAPSVALAAGAGVGARAFDGRAAQPGLGVPRPRGAVDSASVPEGASVAVPRTLPMLALLHGYLGRARLRDLARHGVAAAAEAGATARAALLRRVGMAGVTALRAREVERALLAVGGAVVGGLLTPEDLAEAMPADAEALAGEARGLATLRPPWPVGAEVQAAEAIVACDGRGTIAALSYAPAAGGIAVPELDVTLGRDAVPVRRGVPRVTPGTPLPAAAPIALLQRADVAAAIALPGAPTVSPAALEELADAVRIHVDRGVPTDVDQATAFAGLSALAVVRDGQGARAYSVMP